MVRLLTLTLDEPIPGEVFPEMIPDCGAEEAARRYRAVVLTTLRQMQGLDGTRLRMVCQPSDAAEAIRFWLLPKLADRWQMEGSHFRSHGWEVDFGGDSAGFRVHAVGEVLCPFLGARWLHAAMLGLERGEHRIVAGDHEGRICFRAHGLGAEAHPEVRELPGLRLIRSTTDWDEALAGPLGAALKKHWEEEA